MPQPRDSRICEPKRVTLPMVALAPKDPALNARLQLFEHRVPEELYNYSTDPDALRNLVNDPTHRAKRDELVAMLDAWMVRTKDPMLPVFRDRANLATREAFMREQEKEAAERNAPKRAGKAGKEHRFVVHDVNQRAGFLGFAHRLLCVW